MSKEEVLNDLLGYDGLKVYQRPDMFNFSLDSILLADFVNTEKATKIIDLGTGNCPIPMYLSLKTDADITAIELQEEVYKLARKSVDYNNLGNQITLINDDIKNIYKKIGHNLFDIVTCNPPFFKLSETSRINKNDYLTIARHEVMITLEDIVIEAKKLLKNKGSLYMVHRSERLTDILSVMRKHQIEPKMVKFIYPKLGKESNMVLIEGKKGKNIGGLKILNPLYVHTNNNEYSKDILEIFNYRGR